LQIENLQREIVELEALQKIRNKKIEEINAKSQQKWTAISNQQSLDKSTPSRY
jgi:hypothetical protein